MNDKLYIAGLLLAVVSVVLLNIDTLFYPKIIEDTYQRCNSWCIRDNGTTPCECKEIVEKHSTTPFWWGVIFITLMVIGLVIMGVGWVKKK